MAAGEPENSRTLSATDRAPAPPPNGGKPSEVFRRTLLITRFLDQTDEQIRSRLARLRLLDRLLLLERDGMTGIAPTMVVLALFQGVVGGFDARLAHPGDRRALR